MKNSKKSTQEEDEIINTEAPILEPVYENARLVEDKITGETYMAKPIIGEKIAKEYCIYGSLYKAYYSQLLKFEPVVTLHVLNYLMMRSKLHTNIVEVDYKSIQENLKISKSTIKRCLRVLRDSNVLVTYPEDDGVEYEYINPLIWFRGTKEDRYSVFKKLGCPPIWFKDDFYRSEFRIQS